MKWWWQIKKSDADLERELRSDLELEEEEQREKWPAARRGTLRRSPRLRQCHLDQRTDSRSMGLGAIRASLAGFSLCVAPPPKVTGVYSNCRTDPCARNWKHSFAAMDAKRLCGT